MSPAAATPNVATAAHTAEPATRRRAESRSANVKTALTMAPATNPSCTEIVSQAVSAGESCQTPASVGATADALNHGAIASSSAMARTAGPAADSQTGRMIQKDPGEI